MMMAKKKVAPLTAESQGISHEDSAAPRELRWYLRPLARTYAFAPPRPGLHGGYEDRLAVLAGLIQSSGEMHLAQQREQVAAQEQELARIMAEFRDALDWANRLPCEDAPDSRKDAWLCLLAELGERHLPPHLRAMAKALDDSEVRP
jgi:hypothetical protein